MLQQKHITVLQKQPETPQCKAYYDREMQPIYIFVTYLFDGKRKVGPTYHTSANVRMQTRLQDTIFNLAVALKVVAQYNNNVEFNEAVLCRKNIAMLEYFVLSFSLRRAFQILLYCQEV